MTKIKAFLKKHEEAFTWALSTGIIMGIGAITGNIAGNIARRGGYNHGRSVGFNAACNIIESVVGTEEFVGIVAKTGGKIVRR